MLTLENVSLNYGSFTALNGVSLHADQGELVVLLGCAALTGAGAAALSMRPGPSFVTEPRIETRRCSFCSTE